MRKKQPEQQRKKGVKKKTRTRCEEDKPLTDPTEAGAAMDIWPMPTSARVKAMIVNRLEAETTGKSKLTYKYIYTFWKKWWKQF